MNTFPWSIFIILLGAGLIGTLGVIPLASTLIPKPSAAGEGDLRRKKLPPMPVLKLIITAQTFVLTAVVSFLGLLAAGKVGLGTPILQAFVEGRPVMPLVQEMLPAAVLLAVAAGILILIPEVMVFLPRIPKQVASQDVQGTFRMRALACFYGGINEELQSRLFVMSGLVWLLGMVWKTADGAPATGAFWTVDVFWTANILAALLFGAGHLPAIAANTKLTPMLVARSVLLNGIPGLTCGYLFMRYGLEAAILSHFFLDIVLHLIAPPLLQQRIDVLPAEPAAQPA